MARLTSRSLAGPATSQNGAEVAAHIAETAGELASIAGRARWPLLTYFLNMARVEAEARVAMEANEARSPPAPRRRKRLRSA